MDQSNVPVRPPYNHLRFSDLRAGDRYDLGEQVMVREEMIEFASRYDPRPFHLSDEAARQNPLFERLSASGWNMVLILQMRAADFWDGTQVRGLAGAGVNEIRWAQPVYAGDRLRCEVVIENVRRSASKPDRGLMTMRLTATKLDGRLATSLSVTGVFAAD